jgi:hypothetical protein
MSGKCQQHGCQEIFNKTSSQELFLDLAGSFCHLIQLMDNLHVRLNFNLSKEKGIKHNSQNENNEISKIAKFGCEML